MPLEPPRTLSPSKVSTFKDCALAFRFSAIDRLPEPPAPAMTKGTLVHRALELLFCEPAPDRTLVNALNALARAADELQTDPEFVGLALDEQQAATFLDEAEQLVRRYFELEDPTTINPIGLELGLAVELGGLRLRGIIDRLELDEHGELVVTDYKTGRAPNPTYEQQRLGGVQFYSYLCEQLFGRRPARVQLLYLADPIAIIHTPTDQSTRALETKVKAIWKAVVRACEHDDFRPRTSRLCDWCSFRAYCPAWGGDPAQARELLVQVGSAAPTTDDRSPDDAPSGEPALADALP
jgi:putative RecB family exonuclease